MYSFSPASRPQDGANPKPERAAETSAKLWRTSPGRGAPFHPDAHYARVPQIVVRALG